MRTRSAHRAGIVILATAGLVGCTSSTSPGAGAITVTLTVKPPSVAAGGVLTVTATAVPSGEVSIQVIVIQATGAFVVAESVIVQGADSQSVTRNYAVPTQAPPGSVNFTATARGGSVVGHAQATVFVLPSTYRSVSAGGYHTCGLAADSTAYCWGANGVGQLGAGDTVSRGTPVAVAGGLRFVGLSAGGFHTCALTAAGTAYCWGGGDSVPKVVGGGIPFVQLAAGGTNHKCGITAVGTPYCWGDNRQGQLGDGGTTSSATPVPVASGLTFASISTGGAHSCGLTAAGSAYCWGFNNSGQLGDSTTTDRWSPVAVKGGFTFASLVAGGLHTCALTTTAATYCWGANGSYELGDGTNLDHLTPVAVQSTISFANLGSAVWSHTCGVTGSGLGYCWGDNIFGQIGDGTTASVAPTPHAVAGALTFVAVSGGSDHSCGLSTAHIAYCWGFNGNGQLGTGPLGGTSPTPVPVVGQVP